jgi:hypothetical protein
MWRRSRAERLANPVGNRVQHTVKWDDERDGAARDPGIDFLNICGQGCVVHDAVDSLGFGHFVKSRGVELGEVG